MKRTSLTILALVLLLATAAGAQAPPALRGERDFQIVLIHGLGSRATVWDEVRPFLAGTFDVHTFELTGHGNTPPVPRPTIAGEAERLDEFLADLDIEYPTLVGHGLGGLVALRHALDHPARVHRLIVIDTAPKQLMDEEARKDLMKRLATDYGPTVAERFLAMSPDPATTDRIVDTALRTDSASYINLLKSSLGFDATDELPNLSVPLLIVGSELMFPSDTNPRAVLSVLGWDNTRSLSFKSINLAGHYIMLERPVYTASVLMAFGVTGDHTFDPAADLPEEDRFDDREN